MLIEDAHALVIAISQYLHVPKLSDNHNARDIAGVLGDQTCCGYPPARTRTLRDGDASRLGILAALDELATTTSASSTVFVYFSGHGGARVSPTGEIHYYLAPVDASSEDLENTGISNTELSGKLRAIPADRLTLVLDCCRSGHLADVALAAPSPAPAANDPDLAAIAPLAKGRGRVVIAATRASASAYILPGRDHSVLTEHLIAGLRGAALGVGGMIRICDLFDYVQRQVTAEKEVEQHPVFRAELEDNYPIALLHGGAPATFQLPLPPAATGDPAVQCDCDAFLSYCERDDDDRAWVTRVVVPYLERLGLRLCLEDRDFSPSGEIVEEIENAVARSRYTVAVLTPAYLGDPLERYQAVLAKHLQIESDAPRFLPLLRKPCPLTLTPQMTELLDATRDAEQEATLERLAVALRRSPQPRRSP